MNIRFWQVIVIGFTTLFAAELAVANVGKVIIAKGDTFALDNTNNSRPLKRRSEILEGDTLITGPNSEIHIRFNDNAILALRADSQLKISEYHSNEGGQQEKVLMELLSGGFRTITGTFGKSDKEAYQIRTPQASIGIRGTNYEAILTNNTLIVGVYKGGVKLQNDSGVINLGRDSAYSFARVASPTTAIKGLLEAPKELSKPLATSFKAPAEPNEEADKEKTAQIQEEDESLLIENLFENNESAPATARPPHRPLNTNPIQLAGTDETTQQIQSLNEQFSLDQYQDKRLSQEQLNILMDKPEVGFVVINEDPTGYRVANYQLPYIMATIPTLSANVSFDIVLGSGNNEKVFSVTLSQGSSYSPGALMLELANSLNATAGQIDGTQVQPEIVIDGTSGTLILTGITEDSGQSISFGNFTGTEAQTVAANMGLCNNTSVSCSGHYDLGAPSVGHFDHATHFGYIVPGEAGPVFVNFENESLSALREGFKSPDNVFRGHPNATKTDFTPVDVDQDGKIDVKWGYWDTNSQNPAVLLKDPKDLNVAEQIDSPFYFVSVLPALQADLVGTKTLSNVVAWDATASTGTVTDLSASLSVNFATSEATGNLYMDNSASSWAWDVNYNGHIKGVQFVSDFSYGTLDYNNQTFDVVGHIDGLFTGSSSSLGFASGFGLQTTNDVHAAQGVFIIKE